MRPKEYRIKELLCEKGLDGAIVSSPENFHYVTGFGGHQHTVSRQPGFTLAVMRADDKVPTHLTTMDFEAATFRIKAAGLNFVVDPYDTWVGLKPGMRLPTEQLCRIKQLWKAPWISWFSL